MKFIKRQGKLYTSYLKTAVIAVMFLLVAIPFIKIVSNDGKTYTPDSRYLVVLNGNELGYVSDVSVGENALLDVRTQLGNENDGLTLVETNIEFYKETAGGSVLSQEEMAGTMYNSLSSEVIDSGSEITAYTVRIDDFTVTLSTLEDVKKLLTDVKDKYCESDNFFVEIKENADSAYKSYKAEFVASEDIEDSVFAIDFVENVEIIETKQNSSNVTSVDEAYELITKEHMEKGKYTVVAGDCLSAIARKFNITLDELLAMNYGFTLETAIYEGDILIVTVPASEISVEVVETKAYDETYNAPVQYVDNNKKYVGNNTVIQAGSEGKRSVVANVTYVNGVESGREIIEESISIESVPQIIERGTLTPPTYIYPLYGPISSPWGPRILGESKFHNGVDFAVPEGTAVKASSSGVVVTSGWAGNLGYCVAISHADGSMTKYAHLSGISVAYGQTVLQGQVIGYSGHTGYSFGSHLHFELWIGGCSVNPLLYVQ